MLSHSGNLEQQVESIDRRLKILRAKRVETETSLTIGEPLLKLTPGKSRTCSKLTCAGVAATRAIETKTKLDELIARMNDH